MKVKTTTFLKLFVYFVFISLFFTQAKAQTSFCMAFFSAVDNNCTVTFTNTSVGKGATTQYAWDFGDGQTSAVESPVHTYAGSGTYSVCLTITVPGASGLPPCTHSFCRPVVVTCTGTTGIAGFFDEKSVSIYPNPSSGKFQVYADNKQNRLEMKIYNAVGESVYSTSVMNNQLLLDLSSQPNGIYFVEINSDYGRGIRKLVINK